jgi:putative transposase
LRTGCQWNAIPRELAAGSTAHQYFQEWLEAGVFGLLWQEAWFFGEFSGLSPEFL